jgi:hypothetical protein
VPCAASASTVRPSGVISTLVIRPSEPKPWRHDVGLHVAVVVLARPDDAAVALDDLGDHVVDQPVLVDAGGLELGLEFGLEDLGEDVLERRRRP